jgi:hypothetical protein
LRGNSNSLHVLDETAEEARQLVLTRLGTVADTLLRMTPRDMVDRLGISAAIKQVRVN